MAFRVVGFSDESGAPLHFAPSTSAPSLPSGPVVHHRIATYLPLEIQTALAADPELAAIYLYHWSANKTGHYGALPPPARHAPPHTTHHPTPSPPSPPANRANVACTPGSPVATRSRTLCISGVEACCMLFGLAVSPTAFVAKLRGPSKACSAVSLPQPPPLDLALFLDDLCGTFIKT